MKLFDELTLIIPSFNRQDYLVRTLNFWAERGLTVFALDGSSSPLNDDLVKQLGSNIIYLHGPESLYDRLRASVDLVSTKYVMLGTDDEFYIPSALKRCLIELENDQDLICCGGRAVGFGFDNEMWGVPVYNKLSGLELLCPTGHMRTHKHFSNYVPAHLYSVCRASSWIPIARHVFSREFNFFASWELQFEFLLPYFGLTKNINHLSWLRSYEAEPIRGTSPSMSNAITIEDWWVQDTFLRERDEFNHGMGDLSESLGGSRSDVILSFERAIEIYIQNQRIYDSIKARRRFISFLKTRYFSGFLKVFRRNMNKKNRNTFCSALKCIAASGVEIDHSQIFEIQTLVKDHYA